MKVAVHTQTGKKGGSVEVSDVVFGAPWNTDLVHQVVVGMQANARTAIAHTKMRGEVRGGGKKPWKQKGLGRARHGSSRSPLWRGGGVTFGPRNDKVFAKKINKKMRAKALYSALSQKHRDGEILFVDTLSFKSPKTSDAQNVIKALGSVKGFESLTSKKHNVAYIALPEVDVNIQKSFGNFGNVKVSETRNLNPVDVLKYKNIIIVAPESSTKILEDRMVREAK
tara:strand:+ start:13648 stop:14322 length:675 start_codon:yes stop_codon:yes gene_type:complete